MFRKRIMFILLLFIMAIGAVSIVSAADADAPQDLAIDDNIEITKGNDISASDIDALKADMADESVEASEPNAKITPINLEVGYRTGGATVKLTDLNDVPLANENITLTVISKVSKSHNAKTDSNGIATFKDLVYYDYVDNGNNSYYLNMHDLTVGLWPIKLNVQSPNVIADTVSANLTVKKATANINVNDLTSYYGDNKTFEITLINSATGMPLAYEYLRVKLLNVADEAFLYLTDSQGQIKINVSQFAPGTYRFTIAVANEDNIQPASKSANVVIKELPKKLSIIGTSKKFKNSGQIILKVKDKSTGKYVSGVKLKIKVFTGKKYKTFNLVTKKSKKINNAIAVLLKTNKFSVGTHKVTVKITSAAYKGSATFKLVIPKTAKNYKKFTYVVSNGKAKYV